MESLKRSLAVLLIMAAAAAILLAAGCTSGGGGTSGIQEKSLKDIPEVVNTVKQQADAAARAVNLRTINSAIQAYYSVNGAYPTDVNQLVPDYLKFVPPDPMGGTYYITNESGFPQAAVR
jgi:hypothetical protein